LPKHSYFLRSGSYPTNIRKGNYSQHDDTYTILYAT
jgi:hypothetical protein